MTYANGEALILTQIQNTSTFNSANTSRGNFVIINSGKSAVYCILVPGAFDREQYGGGGKYKTTWRTVAQIWYRLNNYAADIASLQAAVADIVGRFDQYRKAADTTGNIEDVFVRAGGEVFENQMKKGGVFLRQDITIEWKEESLVTLQE